MEILGEPGWRTIADEPEAQRLLGDEFEASALYAMEEEQPDAILLQVRFGQDADDRFRGLGILRKIVECNPRQPVLVLTQYAQGPDRDTAMGSTLRWNAPVDFIDKLASPKEVVLRRRRLIGISPEIIPIGDRIVLNLSTKVVYC